MSDKKTFAVVYGLKDYRKKLKLQEKTATSNGDVIPDPGYDGLSKVTVDVVGSEGSYKRAEDISV